MIADMLHEKSGSADSLKSFRHQFKQAAARDAMPSYHLSYDLDEDRASFKLR